MKCPRLLLAAAGLAAGASAVSAPTDEMIPLKSNVAFGIKEGDPMWRKPEDRAKIW